MNFSGKQKKIMKYEQMIRNYLENNNWYVGEIENISITGRGVSIGFYGHFNKDQPSQTIVWQSVRVSTIELLDHVYNLTILK